MRTNKVKTTKRYLILSKILCCVFAAIKERIGNHNAEVYDQEKRFEDIMFQNLDYLEEFLVFWGLCKNLVDLWLGR